MKELENKGIGRPSTWASIIETIITRAYVNRKQAKLNLCYSNNNKQYENQYNKQNFQVIHNYKDIKEVKVTCFAQAYDILFDPTKYRPESRETADHSLPYCLAAAMVDKKITTESFSDEKLNDPRIYEVIDKIIGEPSQEFEKMFPAKQPSKVVITTNDGREFSEYLEYPKGDPREPMTMDDLEN